jgi:Protein kinase domain
VADTPIGPGTLLAGRFRLEDLLDETDGAKFWRATDRTLARNVAVHVIATSDARAKALLNAARSSATVTDGHLLRVLDAAVEDGMVYVVNEWGSGISLDRMLAEGPLSARRAAWVVKEVAEAISTAHRHGVAHGRLHPENVMVTEAGSVKLIGFVVDAVLHGELQVRVADGEPMSHERADVVNLAALLYALLVGKWPGTEGSSLPQAPLEHGKTMRARQVRAGVPRPLDAICDRVLNPDSHHNHAMPIETAHEIFAALSDFIGDPGGSAHMGYQQTTVLDDDAPTALAAAPVAAEPQSDMDATQAGVPVFYDEDTGVGWMSPSGGRGLRSEAVDADMRPRSTPPPPPPVLQDPEPKPLFAPEPSARPATPVPQPSEAVSRPNTSAGPRNGSLPPVWGPDAHDHDDTGDHGSGSYDTASWNDDGPGKSWLRLAAVIGGVIVLVVAIVFAFNLGRGSGDDTNTSSSGGSPSTSQSGSKAALTIAAVDDFDPEGNPPEENPDLTSLATDGNPATAWKTSTYYGNPKLGGLKSGVGLIVDLGKPKKLASVQLTLIGSPTSVQILAAPDSSTKPTGIDGLDKLASVDGADTKANLTLKTAVTTRYFVVWLTSLPSAPGGYQGQVAEILPRS